MFAHFSLKAHKLWVLIRSAASGHHVTQVSSSNNLFSTGLDLGRQLLITSGRVCKI